MPTITAQNLIDRAAKILNDAANVRWGQQDLVAYLNDGQRETVLLKPEACVTNASVKLTPSSTKQTLPTGAIQLIDVVRNMGAAGTTPGKAIRVVDRGLMDAQNPDWHSDPADATAGIYEFMFDQRDPKHYYVYPQAPATDWFVELVQSSNPVDLPSGLVDGSNTGVISLDDVYANGLLNYMLHRTFLKQSEVGDNAHSAVAYYQAFAATLGVKTQNDAARSPNIAIGKA